MTISIKPTASGSTIEQDGSTILTVDGSGNITPSNSLYPKVPAFNAYLSSNQSIAHNVYTKIAFDGTHFDTNSSFDSTTNYRFQPNIAGYYQINFTVFMANLPDTKTMVATIYKNGSSFHAPAQISNGTNGYAGAGGGCVVYLNGTTDYIEGYTYQNSGVTLNAHGSANKNVTQMSGFLVSV